MINEINDLASEIESIYNGLSDADVNTLREFGQMITFRDGEVIIRKGEHDDAVYILETGKVQAVIDTGLFSKRLHLNIFEGSVFGEMAFIDRRP
ncbi:MAG: cyclic nucleotide-binding domain-containing protein, partial [Alphaproteobacteria bacterium]|nr:cyclic nucleotide-binding domain-containing protein [Alphaproteobacteria bacterium]